MENKGNELKIDVMTNSTKIKSICWLLSTTIFLSSCSSATMIMTIPPGAKVYMNDEPVGVTPYEHRDTKVVGSSTSIRLEKEGYETYYTYLNRDEEVDVGAIVGGVFLLFPFLWVMKYKKSHTYELFPLEAGKAVETKTTPATKLSQSKIDRLRELKQLLDEKIITPEEFEAEKKKILDEKD